MNGYESERAASVGHRVVVTGLAGAGKSTFSKALSAKTGLPLIHLDLHFWKPGWVAPSDDEWREKQRRLLAADAWIADGNYRTTLDLRLERADTVVYLDTPWWTCARRAFVRGLRPPPGAIMPDGCDDSRWRRLRDEWGDRLEGLAPPSLGPRTRARDRVAARTARDRARAPVEEVDP